MPVALLVAAVGLLIPATSPPGPAGQKRLIEFGWDQPTTRFMRDHIAEMRKTPFDGCVFSVQYRKPDGTSSDFTWECWGKRKFTEADFADAVADLQATPFGHFRHNFLRFNVTPGDMDWYDDFGAVLANARLAAEVVRKCPGVEGILFDIETYSNPIFTYGKRPRAGTVSFDQYARQVRRRGAELMRAFEAGCPGITVFLTFGVCLPYVQTEGAKRPLAETDYGLLAALLDGMCAVASPGVTIVDGNELTYGHKTKEQFDQAYKVSRDDALAVVRDPTAYARHLSVGFGVWMDYDWRGRGWDMASPEANYFTPKAFEGSIAAALAVADRYVWVYTETPRWWTPEGGPAKLPRAYDAALRMARLNGGHRGPL